jgi:hypothetical protein
MRRTVLVAAAGAVALVGAGSAVAASPGSVTSGRPVGGTALAAVSAAGDSQSAKPTARPQRWRHLLRRVQHAQVATSGRNGSVLYDAIRGAVSAVSPTSLTVRATDSFQQTFLLSPSATRVRIRPAQAAAPNAGKGKPGSLSDIHVGDEVFALGRSADRTGAAPTAQIVVVGVKR